MLLDPNSPASELTVRAEIALRMVQANATLAAGARGQLLIDEHIIERSIRTADKFIQMLNYEPEPVEDHLEYFRENYLG